MAAEKPGTTPTGDPHLHEKDAALHNHREMSVVVPIEEEAHEGDVHINLGWRSWVSRWMDSTVSFRLTGE